MEMGGQPQVLAACATESSTSNAPNRKMFDFLSKAGLSRKLYLKALRQPLFETSSAPYPYIISRDTKINEISTQLNP
jgi:hypothetical protein